MLAAHRRNRGVQAPVCDSGCAGEDGNRTLGRNELALAEWDQLSDGDAVPCDDEGFAAVEPSHDLAALVPQFALRDLSRHQRAA